MSTASIQPPRAPASPPTSSPSATDATLATSAMPSDTRAPITSRAKTSRPELSAPSSRKGANGSPGSLTSRPPAKNVSGTRVDVSSSYRVSRRSARRHGWKYGRVSAPSATIRIGVGGASTESAKRAFASCGAMTGAKTATRASRPRRTAAARDLTPLLPSSARRRARCAGRSTRSARPRRRGRRPAAPCRPPRSPRRAADRGASARRTSGARAPATP